GRGPAVPGRLFRRRASSPPRPSWAKLGPRRARASVPRPGTPAPQRPGPSRGTSMAGRARGLTFTENGGAGEGGMGDSGKKRGSLGRAALLFGCLAGVVAALQCDHTEMTTPRMTVPGPVADFSDAFTRAADAIRPSVVRVDTDIGTPSQPGTVAHATGSGVI